MHGFAAGWDGGGTKTAVCCLDENGRRLGGVSSGGLNLNGLPESAVGRNVAEIMGWMKAREEMWGPCLSLAIGTAGASNPAAVRAIEGATRSAGYGGRLFIAGDHEIALRGAVGKVGAVLIAGTGSIACGRNARGEAHRAGGFGHLFDDEGSGYAIGRDILSAVVRAHDGRERETALTGPVFRALKISTIPELIRSVYARAAEKQHIAGLAPLLAEGLRANDAASLAIADKAADGLARILSAVLGRLGLGENAYAFLGSVLDHYPGIADGVEARVLKAHPRARRIKPVRDAAYGAAALALDHIAGPPRPEGELT